MDSIEELIRHAIAQGVRSGLAESRVIIREECIRALKQNRAPKQADDAVLSSVEAAELCGVKAVTIRDWVKKKRIQPLSEQTPYRFMREEVLRARDMGRDALKELMEERYLSVQEANSPAKRHTEGLRRKAGGGGY